MSQTGDDRGPASLPTEPGGAAAATAGEGGIAGLLSRGEFRKLWLGQIFSQLADKFYIVLMVFLIAQYWVTENPQADPALAEAAAAIRMGVENRAQIITLLATGIYVANTIPAMLLGTVAGVWADRWPKRAVMVSSNALRAGLLLLAPLALLPGPTWLGLSWGYWALVAMTVLESVLTQFFAPAEQAAIPLLVPSHQLLAANSLYQATSMGATIVGFALGDPILRLMHGLLQKLGINGGASFYSLRRMTETIGGGCKDQVAVDSVMGHSRGDMASVYRLDIDDSRLEAVANHIRAWLFPV